MSNQEEYQTVVDDTEYITEFSELNVLSCNLEVLEIDYNLDTEQC